MKNSLSLVSLLVEEYDPAIEFFTQKLDFTLVEDTPLNEQKRWVVVSPKGSEGTKLLLAKATNAIQQSRIGNQTGGRVFLFLETDDFWRDYKLYRERGVKFVRDPKQEAYGLVAVFEDLSGNGWDLIQPSKK
ncbi:MAG: VOC family protein [Cyclobacteriaceae bacterium]|jgi:catechol 2,3-dioxygenase-like lactoylglutathione lyase family enzyme|nr:VOC family protein [Cyclobacteriaceae bacterium]